MPWQTDTSSCRSGYPPIYDLYVPSFWPARVPIEVLTRENYEMVMDTLRLLPEGRKAFANREARIELLGIGAAIGVGLHARSRWSRMAAPP